MRVVWFGATRDARLAPPSRGRPSGPNTLARLDGGDALDPVHRTAPLRAARRWFVPLLRPSGRAPRRRGHIGRREHRLPRCGRDACTWFPRIAASPAGRRRRLPMTSSTCGSISGPRSSIPPSASPGSASPLGPRSKTWTCSPPHASWPRPPPTIRCARGSRRKRSAWSWPSNWRDGTERRRRRRAGPAGWPAAPALRGPAHGTAGRRRWPRRDRGRTRPHALALLPRLPREHRRPAAPLARASPDNGGAGHAARA